MERTLSAGRWLTRMVVHEPRPERFDERGHLIERGTLGYAEPIEWEPTLRGDDVMDEFIEQSGRPVPLEVDGYRFKAYATDVRAVAGDDDWTIVTFVPTGPIEQFSR
jgi:hypothetical protein